MAEFDPADRSAILSRDTSADVERLQIEAWRRMSPLEKAGIMSQATSDALTLTQFWHAEGMLGSHLAAHDFFFTVGKNIGTPGCPIPTSGLTWRRKRRFLVLDEWPVCREADRNRFTTVAAWRGAFGPVEHGGRRYGLKVHEFRKFISLPQRAPRFDEVSRTGAAWIVTCPGCGEERG